MACITSFPSLLPGTSETWKRLPWENTKLILWNLLLLHAFISLLITWTVHHRGLLTCPGIFNEVFPMLLRIHINELLQTLYNISQTHYPLGVNYVSGLTIIFGKELIKALSIAKPHNKTLGIWIIKKENFLKMWIEIVSARAVAFRLPKIPFIF